MSATESVALQLVNSQDNPIKQDYYFHFTNEKVRHRKFHLPQIKQLVSMEWKIGSLLSYVV